MTDRFGADQDFHNLLLRLTRRVADLERNTPGALGGGSVNAPFSIGGYSFGGAQENIRLAELAKLPYVPDIFPTVADRDAAIGAPELGRLASVAGVVYRAYGTGVGEFEPMAGAPWQSWTYVANQTFTGDGGAFVLGTGGSFLGRYRRQDGWVDAEFFLAAGTGPTAGTGRYFVTLPYATSTSLLLRSPIGQGEHLDVPAVQTRALEPRANNSTNPGAAGTCYIFSANWNADWASTNDPVTTGDEIILRFRYPVDPAP